MKRAPVLWSVERTRLHHVLLCLREFDTSPDRSIIPVFTLHRHELTVPVSDSLRSALKQRFPHDIAYLLAESLKYTLASLHGSAPLLLLQALSIAGMRTLVQAITLTQRHSTSDRCHRYPTCLQSPVDATMTHPDPCCLVVSTVRA